MATVDAAGIAGTQSTEWLTEDRRKLVTEEERIKLLEKALLAYVERYGILEGAREYLGVS